MEPEQQKFYDDLLSKFDIIISLIQNPPQPNTQSALREEDLRNREHALREREIALRTQVIEVQIQAQAKINEEASARVINAAQAQLEIEKTITAIV